MGGHFLELAGYATAAVDDLVVTGATPWTLGSTGDYESALLETDGERTLIVRRPNSAAAAKEQAAMSGALAALTSGLRARLSFAVPDELAVYASGGTQVGVYEFIHGTTSDRVPLDHDSLIVKEIGRAIAAVHGLPKQYLEEAGLPTQTAADSREGVERLLAKARATELLPAALDDRWGGAVDDSGLWDFVPSVVHGSLERRSFVTNGAGVVGLLDWSDLRIDDPAHDLAWLQTLDGAVMRAVLDEYTDARGASVDRQIRPRSLLYAELELARWLLHGVESADEAVIADAEQLLDGLVNRVRALDQTELRHETLPVLDILEVQELLADAGAKTRHHEARLQAPVRQESEPPEVEALEDVEHLDDLTDDERR